MPAGSGLCGALSDTVLLVQASQAVSTSHDALTAMMMSPPATRAARSILPPDDYDERGGGGVPHLHLSGSRPSSAKALPA